MANAEVQILARPLTSSMTLDKPFCLFELFCSYQVGSTSVS